MFRVRPCSWLKIGAIDAFCPCPAHAQSQKTASKKLSGTQHGIKNQEAIRTMWQPCESLHLDNRQLKGLAPISHRHLGMWRSLVEVWPVAWLTGKSPRSRPYEMTGAARPTQGTRSLAGSISKVSSSHDVQRQMPCLAALPRKVEAAYFFGMALTLAPFTEQRLAQCDLRCGDRQAGLGICCKQDGCGAAASCPSFQAF